MIPLSSPGRALELDREEIDEAISRVLGSGRLILGPENEALSEEMSTYLGCADTVLVGNGTDALEIALLAVGVKRGASVITVANAGGYASTAISKIGAIPRYVDVSDFDLEMEIQGSFGLEALIASSLENPAAIVLTHLFGNAGPVEKVLDVAMKYAIPVVEDCAQSFGATLRGKKLGTFGTVSTTSFYPTKNLGALGDGGAIFTSDQQVAERARALRQYGWTERYHSKIGEAKNSRLDEIQAAVLRLRLQKIDIRNRTRLSIYRRYVAASGRSEEINFPHASSEAFVGHLAVLRTENRDDIRKFLAKKGISTDIHYPLCDHQQLPWIQFSTASLPVSERDASRILSIPLFPEMRESEIESIELALNEIKNER